MVLRRGTAVVIEDDADIRGLLVTLLTQSGFEVHDAANGQDGVELVVEHDPVVVTVDVGLPDIDGFEVTRRVRTVTDAYIVMLTAMAEEIDTLMGLDSGADDYIVKPFRPRELRARIEAMLRRPRNAHGGEGPKAQRRETAASGLAPKPETSRPARPMGVEGLERQHFLLDGLRLYPRLYRVLADDTETQLTPTQFVLLRTLMASGRVVRSKSELFRILREEDPDAGTFVSEADERTIEVHMGNLRRKLGDDVRQPRWVETVRGIGYRLSGSPRLVEGD